MIYSKENEQIEKEQTTSYANRYTESCAVRMIMSSRQLTNQISIRRWAPWDTLIAV